jgi:hypothetical protein
MASIKKIFDMGAGGVSGKFPGVDYGEINKILTDMKNEQMKQMRVPKSMLGNNSPSGYSMSAHTVKKVTFGNTCHHCGKIIDIENELSYTIQRNHPANVTGGADQAGKHFHLECFKSIAGEDYL